MSDFDLEELADASACFFGSCNRAKTSALLGHADGNVSHGHQALCTSV